MRVQSTVSGQKSQPKLAVGSFDSGSSSSASKAIPTPQVGQRSSGAGAGAADAVEASFVAGEEDEASPPDLRDSREELRNAGALHVSSPSGGSFNV